MTSAAVSWLDRPIAQNLAGLSREAGLTLVIITLAVISRYYELGQRVISFDEVNHVVPSYDLYQGRGYRYDPITHGPLQFHMIALSFFLFGDSDASARVPAALFGIGAIAFVLLAYRRFLGRAGALSGGFLLLISPYMLFYGRYARNEIYIAFWAAAMLYAVLAYLESGKPRYIFIFSLVNALHFVDKTTAYIFAGEIVLFLGLFFSVRILSQAWANPRYRRYYIAALLALLIFVGVALGVYVTGKPPAADGGLATPSSLPTISPNTLTPAARNMVLLSVLGCVFSTAAALYCLIKGLGAARIRQERSFDLILLEITIVLPLSAAIFIQAAGFDPLNSTTSAWLTSGLFILPLAIAAISIGLWWRAKIWLKCMAIFWSIFVVFYSTFFTNASGVPMGLVSALGYWMAQQSVQRGSQPLYYYLFLQLPIYEFLPALGMLVAIAVGFRNKLWIARPGLPFRRTFTDGLEVEGRLVDEPALQPAPTLALLTFWSISSLLIFSVAGERMPWLTVHIALPMILTAGWGVGYLFETIHWDELFQLHRWLIWRWRCVDILRTTVLLLFAFLAVLTLRTAMRAAYINYDTALEFLVYAHSARGPKDALAYIEEISKRTSAGKDIVVAYDNDINYPYWWYLRDYPKKVYFGDQPTRELRNYSLVAVGEAQFSKVDAILGSDYYKYETMRLLWPMQDYTNLTWDRITNALLDPAMRSAVFQIWFNRNYQPYAALKNRSDLTLTNWQPSQRMRLYIRKDILAQMWTYGSSPITAPTHVDPYAGGKISLSANQVSGSAGAAPGQFNAPRQMACAADGSLYVADSRNNRVQHLSADGKTELAQWGTFADAAKGSAPGGTFNEPWGIAVGPDGSVYVADTWNHRIEKFSADGSFVSMWGSFGEGNGVNALWGPRGLAVDSQGRLFVADTGNKRIVVYDANGQFISQFGGAGTHAGQFDEPVGVAVDQGGRVYVADTWNQRVQVMAPDATGRVYTPVLSWVIDGWYGQSLENKPFIAIDDLGHVFVTDPEGYRVLEFTTRGEFVRTWSLEDNGEASGVTVVGPGDVWVSDATHMQLFQFSMSP